MSYIPFCIIEKPYAIWAPDVRADNEKFLTRLDTRFYERMARSIVEDFHSSECDTPTPADVEQSYQERRDVSTLARLLWHHGMETLVMLLGAYIQATAAVHGYFLKCKTEDAVRIAGYLLREERPRYHRLNDVPFALSALLTGIYQQTGCSAGDVDVVRLTEALRSMLNDYVRDSHRAEYNSIKHGLRASHGIFSIALAPEEKPGVAPPQEAMRVIGSSQDASFFNVTSRLDNATNQQSRINFSVEQVSVTWTLERVLMEIQILSILLVNTVAALRCVNGAPPGTVQVNKIINEAEFWAAYDQSATCDVPTASLKHAIDAKQVPLLTEKHVFDSYRRHTARSGAGD